MCEEFGMKQDPELINLSKNLRFAVSSFSSVAEICRRSGINRQQFNKYLSGQHRPSHRVLVKLSRFLSIEERDLFMKADDFERFYEGVESDLTWDLRNSREFIRFGPLARTSAVLLRPYYGVYYRYHNSSIYKGRVLRSVLCIFEKNGLAQHVYIERFPATDGKSKSQYLFRYHGLCVFLGDRIFLVDSERIQKNEMTFAILTPSHRNTVRFLFGLISGVAATSFRQPFATRMALDFQSRGMITKRHLKDATVLDPEDSSIPLELRAYLANPAEITVWGGAE
jgi:transcriptional regulator with XRE-family HTH domain